MKIGQECMVCYSEKNLHFHECRASICDDCVRLDNICQNCNNAWDLNYQPIQIQNYISALNGCSKHNGLVPDKLPTYFCIDCFNKSNRLDDIFNSISKLAEVPEYLKIVHKLIFKDEKEPKIEFLKNLLGYLGICCVLCQGKLEDNEKPLKACKNCWETVENLGPSCKAELEAKYYSWNLGNENTSSDLFLQFQALSYFTKKLNYNPAFNCSECGISFETPDTIPIDCEPNNILNNKKKVVCTNCIEKLDNSYKISRYEFNRLCINNCGYAGECLLKCNHSVCYECCSGKYFICCKIANNIEELEKNNENYFYLCESHQISSDLFSEKTGEFYCKYCTEDIPGMYKVSQNPKKFSKFLFHNFKKYKKNTNLINFCENFSSIRYNLCKPIFDYRTNVYLFENIIPERPENLSQSWVVNPSDIYAINFIALEIIEISGVYITGTLNNGNYFAHLEVHINKEKKYNINFRINKKRFQLIKIDTLLIEKDSVCEMVLTFRGKSKFFCYSGVMQKSSPYLELNHHEIAGLFYGIKKLI